MRTPVLIGSEIYRRSRYSGNHPLAIPRVSTTLDLIRAEAWVMSEQYHDSPIASVAELCRFHDAAYVDAVRRAEAEQDLPPEERARWRLGCDGNPIFGEIFRRPATACGGSLLAAELLAAGVTDLVYHPAGGTHHGRPDRASGFCYFNDPVLAMLRLFDRGVGRIVYADLDAHHGDGVEAAFAGRHDVLTLSIHEAGRWPYTGTIDDRAGGSARNLPVPAGFNDAELDYLITYALAPLAEQFQADVIVIQAGADALADDPLSRLSLSNSALWRAVMRLVSCAPRALVLGGGGYNPWSVARCWAGLWAQLNGIAIPEVAGPEAQAILRSLSWHRSAGRTPPAHWLDRLTDPTNAGPVRYSIRRVANNSLS